MATAKSAKASAKKGASGAKGVTKTSAKTVSKTTKTAAKPVTKAATAKAAKPAPKPAVKAPPKPVTKTAVKPAAKPAVKSAPKITPPQVQEKPVAKPAAKTAERVGGLLTEAEVIKQAKTDYMSKDQLAFFKHRLLELQSQLRENAGVTTEHLRELAVAPDPADRATLEEEHALELRARDRERKLLKKVVGALARIEDGSYGYCEETGEPIGIERLLARPTATLTIEAQERRELKQKMYGE